jgi:hypothetical protein
MQMDPSFPTVTRTSPDLSKANPRVAPECASYDCVLRVFLLTSVRFALLIVSPPHNNLPQIAVVSAQ